MGLKFPFKSACGGASHHWTWWFANMLVDTCNVPFSNGRIYICPISCVWCRFRNAKTFDSRHCTQFTWTKNMNYYHWGKVMFLHVSVILYTGGCVVSQHALHVVFQHTLQQVSRRDFGIPACLAGFKAHTQGGSWGVWLAGSPGPHPVVSRPTPRGGVSQHALRQTPSDGYCHGQYASYWNAFLWLKILALCRIFV